MKIMITSLLLSLLTQGSATWTPELAPSAIHIPAFSPSISHTPAFNPSTGVEKITPANLQSFIENSDHPIIIEFWATFCLPCLVEIAYLEEDVDRYKEQGVELVLVNVDLEREYPDNINSVAAKRGFNVRSFWLTDRSASDRVRAAIDPKYTASIPCSLFINNKTHYRRFFDRQLTDLQVLPEIKKML